MVSSSRLWAGQVYRWFAVARLAARPGTEAGDAAYRYKLGPLTSRRKPLPRRSQCWNRLASLAALLCGRLDKNNT